MEFKSLKETYPQKYYLKAICQCLYYLGCGNCWYEETTRTKFIKIIYPLWVCLANGYVIIGIINQLAAYLIELTPKERYDLLQNSIAHPTIYMKVCALYMQRSHIKVMLKKFLEDTRSIYSSSEIDKAAVKKALKTVIALGAIIYVSIVSLTLDAVISYFTKGIPVRLEVTFFPRPGVYSGFFINILQFFILCHWYYTAAYMALVDGLCICSMVFLEGKFKLLQLYYRNLGNIFTENTEGKCQKELDDEFKKGFIVGIKLHQDALRSSTSMQNALGYIYSVQIIQSITLCGMSIIKFLVSEITPSFVIASLFYSMGMAILTGSYMIIAGGVAYEASQVPTAIFHSGWENSHSLRELQPYIMVALQRSQKPIEMTAFGIIILSYSNFISIIRSSYSYCAVMIH